MPETNDQPKPGRDTSEHASERESSVWGIVATVLGFLITAGSTIASQLGQDATAGIIAGAVVAAAALAERTLVKLGYINSRTKVKEANERRKEAEAIRDAESARSANQA